MHLKHALCALLLCPLLAIAQTRDDLQTIRYLAFSTSSHLLLYFNANAGTPDIRHADKYHAELQQLNALLAQSASAELQEAGTHFQARIAELEKQRDAAPQLYPIWINPVLEAQARLDGLTQKLTNDSNAEDVSTQQLERLTLNVQRLLLYYQTRSFGSLAVYIDELKQDAPQSLDSAIRQDLSALRSSLPGHSQVISGLERKYNYVRGHLLQQDSKLVPGSAAYYLERISAESRKLLYPLRRDP